EATDQAAERGSPLDHDDAPRGTSEGAGRAGAADAAADDDDAAHRLNPSRAVASLWAAASRRKPLTWLTERTAPMATSGCHRPSRARSARRRRKWMVMPLAPPSGRIALVSRSSSQSERPWA